MDGHEVISELRKRCHRLVASAQLLDKQHIDVQTSVGPIRITLHGRNIRVILKHREWGIDYILINEGMMGRSDHSDPRGLDDMILDPLRRWMVLDDLADV